MVGSSPSYNFRDVSKRAQSTLDHILAGTEEKQILHQASQMPVTEALGGDRVVSFASHRTKSRVLFLSSDPKGLNEDSWLQRHVLDLQEVFAEIHVVVLSSGTRDYKTKRIAHNVWVYHVSFSHFLFVPQATESFAEAQLQFRGGFRPDVIVALDPFYAGVAGETLAKRYDRPLQVHVLTDIFAPGYVENNKENKEKVTMARKILKQAKSVRTNSSVIRDSLEKLFPQIEDLGMLPRHFDADSLVKTKRTDLLKQKYPQYVFIMLTAGVLDHDSTIYRTIDAARTLLLSPKIALVIVGDGPKRQEYIERTELLGIKEQVVFESNTALLPDYMLSADLFICTDTTAVGDEYVIQAAAAGMPIVMAKTPMRQDLFVDGEAGLLNDAEDTLGFTQKLNSVLNTNAYRLQFGTNARQVVRDRLQTDPNMYRTAYRDSIEVVFGTSERPDDILAGVEADGAPTAAEVMSTTAGSENGAVPMTAPGTSQAAAT